MSTGISPWAYPVPDIPVAFWRDLPSRESNLLDAAARYYGCSKSAVTVSPGSQLAIRLLPGLINKKQTVAIPIVGYQEHLHSWHQAGHKVHFYRDADELESLVVSKSVNSAVVINPNNPTGDIIPAACLEGIANQLPGVLVVDEAFADLSSSHTLADKSGLNNVLILRSIGKFFGLAGTRIGFTIGKNQLNDQLRALFTPWSCSTPSMYAAELALNDTMWQFQQRERILAQADLVHDLFGILVADQDGPVSKTITCGLFYSIFADDTWIKDLQGQFARQKIWTRIGDEIEGQNWLRFSLPGDQIVRFSEVARQVLQK